MNALQLRSELIELIKRTDDVKVLGWLKSILTEPELSKELIEDMVEAAQESEKDIAAGRTYSTEKTRRWMSERKGEA